jgi:CDP-glycerol glycerophosphotransferase
MFDFAVTGKPIIYYTYDLEQYRDAIRGFYFDLRPVAPGPLVESTEGVIAALRDLPALESEFAERYSDFRRTFCSLDDGHATDRVLQLVDKALSGSPAAASLQTLLEPALESR